MHSYLRAVGFSEFKNKRDIEIFLRKIIKDTNRKITAVEHEDSTFLLLEKCFGEDFRQLRLYHHRLSPFSRNAHNKFTLCGKFRYSSRRLRLLCPGGTLGTHKHNVNHKEELKSRIRYRRRTSHDVWFTHKPFRADSSGNKEIFPEKGVFHHNSEKRPSCGSSQPRKTHYGIWQTLTRRRMLYEACRRDLQ